MYIYIMILTFFYKIDFFKQRMSLMLIEMESYSPAEDIVYEYSL